MVGGIKLGLVKTGDDDLVVNKIRIVTDDLGGTEHEYDCKGYTLTKQGKTCKVCNTSLYLS